jgi:hypothetical protein
MYLKEIKSALTVAMRNSFANTLNPDFTDMYIEIEFPMQRQNYPGMWVGFEPIGNITRGGINNTSYLISVDGVPNTISLWRSAGYATFTIGALTSTQRDRLFDEVVRTIAFSAESAVHPFRATIESNPLIAMNGNFDEISVRGLSENPGTPWDTPEIIYEATLAMEIVIEFASDNLTQQLAALTLTEIDISATPTTPAGILGPTRTVVITT